MHAAAFQILTVWGFFFFHAMTSSLSSASEIRDLLMWPVKVPLGKEQQMSLPGRAPRLLQLPWALRLSQARALGTQSWAHPGSAGAATLRAPLEAHPLLAAAETFLFVLKCSQNMLQIEAGGNLAGLLGSLQLWLGSPLILLVPQAESLGALSASGPPRSSTWPGTLTHPA